MVYHDSNPYPMRRYYPRDLYDPWDDDSITPVAPADENVRQAVLAAIERHPRSPSRVKAHLEHVEHLDVPIEVIYGVKAEM